MGNVYCNFFACCPAHIIILFFILCLKLFEQIKMMMMMNIILSFEFSFSSRTFQYQKITVYDRQVCQECQAEVPPT